MKSTLLLTTICLLSAGCVAHAHTAPLSPAPTIEVTLGWVWIDAHLSHGHWTKGHWSHPHYGQSYKRFNQGPPPARPHGAAHWAQGHWEGQGPHKRWVAGHWK